MIWKFGITPKADQESDFEARAMYHSSLKVRKAWNFARPSRGYGNI